MGPNQPPG
jgi:hypothetical protein